MNELLLFIEIIIMFSLLLLAKKLFGKEGIFVWIGISSVIANIQVSKCIDIFGISGTLGNVLFASVFLATDILNECYSEKDAKKGVYIGLFSVIIYLISMQLSLLFIASDIDVVHDSMVNLFGLAPRICIASVLMFFISNLLDVKIYSKLKNKFKGKKMWIRNNLSTIICNCLDNFGFVFLAFSFSYSFIDIIEIAISTCFLEIIIALCDTPFLYLSKKFIK